ncbi:uncharacterized protein LOC144619785 [Crassostrea virginica]
MVMLHKEYYMLYITAMLWILFVQPIFCLYEDKPCKESQNTAVTVQFCPKGKAEWEDRAKKKNCSSVPHNCTRNLEYHCVVNPWQTETIEVCAPSTIINAGYCAEYNHKGRRIQDFYKETCSSCTTNYLSTEAYLHPECYIVAQEQYTQDNTSAPTTKSKRSDINMTNRGTTSHHFFSKSHWCFILIFYVLLQSSYG